MSELTDAIGPDDRERWDRWIDLPIRKLALEVHGSMTKGGAHREVLQLAFNTQLAEASLSVARWTKKLAIMTGILALATVALVVTVVLTS